MARDNQTLGRFRLEGLPPAPRGVPQIEVSFDIDANGIVSVTAKDVASGKAQSITISGASGLSKADVERAVKDAEAHAADDKARRELVDARNQIDTLVYSVEKMLAEHQAMVPASDRERAEHAVAAARQAAAGENLAAMTAAMTDLQQASQAVATAAGSGRASNLDQAPDVKEGEVVEV